MPGSLTRFLGDTPVRVVLKLLLLSLVVGFLLSWLDIRPLQILAWGEEFVREVTRMGFAFFADAGGYLLLGALVVVPLFLLGRLFRLGGRRTGEE